MRALDLPPADVRLLESIAVHAEEAIGDTADREGDAYQQGVRDLARALLGRPPAEDRLRLGGLAGALEGWENPG